MLPISVSFFTVLTLGIAICLPPRAQTIQNLQRILRALHENPDDWQSDSKSPE